LAHFGKWKASWNLFRKKRRELAWLITQAIEQTTIQKDLKFWRDTIEEKQNRTGQDGGGRKGGRFTKRPKEKPAGEKQVVFSMGEKKCEIRRKRRSSGTKNGASRNAGSDNRTQRDDPNGGK